MRDWKATGKKLLFPPGWLMILLTVVSTMSLIAVFVCSLETHPAAYVVYVLSAYALTTLCAFFSATGPSAYRKFKQKLYEHPFGNRYMTDIDYKVRVSLHVSLAINLIYSAFKLTIGILYASFWWGAIAVYYIVLSLIRFVLLKYMRAGRHKQGLISEFKRYRLCGILMVLLNLTLTGVVLHMMVQDQSYVYPEVIIIASATYTFYTVTVSIIDLVKYRKYESPVMSASKAIRFAAALVSLLSLETAMLVRYGESDDFRRVMTASTGAGVCIIVLTVSIYMIVRATTAMKKLRMNEPGMQKQKE